jgi:hypothetical protein
MSAIRARMPEDESPLPVVVAMRAAIEMNPSAFARPGARARAARARAARSQWEARPLARRGRPPQRQATRNRDCPRALRRAPASRRRALPQGEARRAGLPPLPPPPTRAPPSTGARWRAARRRSLRFGALGER